MQPVQIQPFRVGSILAIAAAIIGLLIALSVIPNSPVLVGVAIILLGLAFFI